jgi:hypothetical protein
MEKIMFNKLKFKFYTPNDVYIFYDEETNEELERLKGIAVRDIAFENSCIKKMIVFSENYFLENFAWSEDIGEFNKFLTELENTFSA